MKKQIKITEYGFSNYTLKDKGSNYSDIVTKMVQLAGRLCEKYASDIIYDANAFIKAIAEGKDFDRYLVYREMGVTALGPDDIDNIDESDYIQVWHLTYNADTEDQKFARVSVYFERRYF
jgi:hypothetical protein